jgi:malonate-semialdehyde dehydrogenase (acetylating)/methylmalonate-semialdehyde dehydrogenase
MEYTVPHHINGKTYPEQTETLKNKLYNPALGEIIGEVILGGKETCDAAVKAASKAWPSWSQTPPIKRARILFSFRELLEKYQLDLAKLITKEHGKTLEDSKGSIIRAIEVVEMHCGLVSQLQGTFTTEASAHIDCHTMRQSLGVCAGVSPFNFPVMVPVWMMIPAIACGNTFILKPSEQDPSPPLRLLELLYEAGLPDGVANCVQGGKSTVDYLLHHPDIRAFTAVASTPVAEGIYRTAIANGKRAHTFGGAKNHCVIMPDANMNQAAKAIVGAAFGSAGERCMAISVVVTVGEATAEAFLEKAIPLIRDIRIDSGDKSNVDMGPLISQAHRERVLKAIEKGIAEGASLVIDGRFFKHPVHHNGFFLGPCLFDNVDASMSIYQNEIFGPVLVMIRVKDFEQALDLINHNQYGNGTAIFTKDGYTAREYTHKVQVGMVGINIPIPVPIASHPFGGWKRSGFGDTNMHGHESIHFYTKLKTITSKWPATELNESSFSMPTNQANKE